MSPFDFNFNGCWQASVPEGAAQVWCQGLTSKPVIPREQAGRDVCAAQAAALGFIDALAQAYEHISRHAATGSPYYAHELGLAGLRFWPLTRYPYLVFYIECDDHIDVWRVLHSRRDIPELMRAGGADEAESRSD